MNFDGIEIDMLFARLALKEIPDTMVSGRNFFLSYIISESPTFIRFVIYNM
jgi:poly(A) polymerase Pap1